MPHPPDHDGPPPPPPHRPPPHWNNLDQMKDEDVLRFAPPEIRRLWKRMVGVEEQLADVRETLRRIEGLLTKKADGP